MASHGASKIEQPQDSLTAKASALSNSPTPIHEEYQYLNLIRDILASGEQRPDRYRLRSNPPPPPTSHGFFPFVH
jgi:hypothetical protein